MNEIGLTADDGLKQAWFVTTEGEVTGGAEAVNQTLHFVWWARPFTYLYKLPGFKQLEDKIYTWVAENRYRLPGSTATCQLSTPKETK